MISIILSYGNGFILITILETALNIDGVDISDEDKITLRSPQQRASFVF